MRIVSIADYRTRAKRRLPHFLFEYLDGGALEEASLRDNISALAKIRVRQRVLRDVSGVDTSADILGRQSQLPVVLAPIGLAGLIARRGEQQAARAAHDVGVPFCLSTMSVCSVEEVGKSCAAPFWFQVYIMRDRGFMRELLDKVKAAGCTTIVFTVDMPVPGIRRRDYRSGLTGATGLVGELRRLLQAMQRPRWSWDVGIRGRPHVLGNIASTLRGGSGMSDYFGWIGANFDASVTWQELEQIRADWSGSFVVKGIMDADDARIAAAIGADGIVVSNHGGRQLDGVRATCDAIPRVVEAVGDDTIVLADGGIRSGLDIVRMMALGARGVMIGRGWAYALASGGEAGVRHALTLLQSEMRVVMALSGVARVGQIDRTLLEPS